jgi:hypothetical protein
MTLFPFASRKSFEPVEDRPNAIDISRFLIAPFAKRRDVAALALPGRIALLLLHPVILI